MYGQPNKMNCVISHTGAGGSLNNGSNLCLQYSWKRSVQIINGIVKLDVDEDFLNPKTANAIICISTIEKIVVLCTIGQ